MSDNGQNRVPQDTATVQLYRRNRVTGTTSPVGPLVSGRQDITRQQFLQGMNRPTKIYQNLRLVPRSKSRSKSR